MVITGRTEEMLQEATKIVTDFLAIRGLQLNENKTDSYQEWFWIS